MSLTVIQLNTHLDMYLLMSDFTPPQTDFEKAVVGVLFSIADTSPHYCHRKEYQPSKVMTFRDLQIKHRVRYSQMVSIIDLLQSLNAIRFNDEHGAKMEVSSLTSVLFGPDGRKTSTMIKRAESSTVELTKEFVFGLEQFTMNECGQSTSDPLKHTNTK